MTDPAGSAAECVVFIGDTHCGDRAGLAPSQFEIDDKSIYQANPVQRWLLECWEDFWRRTYGVLADARWDLVFMGDAIEGVHHGGRSAVSQDASVHVRMAIAMLKDPAERCRATGGRILMVRGTECHTGPSSESVIGMELGAERNPIRGGYSWDHLRFRFNGLLYSCCHHIGTSRREWTKLAGIGYAMVDERAAAANTHNVLPDVVVRAHRHTMAGGWQPGLMGFVTPPWKLFDRYTHKAVPGGSPVVGGIIHDARHAAHGDVPAVHRFEYPQPVLPEAIL